MATKVRKVKVPDRPDYTRQPSGCLVYTIEAVLRHTSSSEEAEAIQEALNTLQQYGGAAVVQVDTVAEDWDVANRILNAREVV